MNKQGPNLVRVLTMVVFSLSCFAILTFLWVSFGGSIPLRPKQYEISVNFPSATTLAQAADVRISGVPIGKVRQLSLDKGAAQTTAVLDIDPKFAPLPADTRAVLRQKTLLGETFVELTPGSPGSGRLRDGAVLANARVEPTVELDQILRIFDPPTKAAFRNWVASSSRSISGTAPRDLNDALGNLAGFAQDGAGLLQILDQQHVAVRDVVHNTGVVFGALGARQGQLRSLIVGSEGTFSATASQARALAATFRVFPTFLDESRSTLARLQRFATNTRPLVNALKPVAGNLGPTVTDLGNLAPDLQNLFVRLKPVISASSADLPQASRFLRGAPPVFAGLQVFLPELNPILSYLNFDQSVLGGFISDGGAGFHYKLANSGDGVARLALAQYGILNGKSINFAGTQPAYDRGNAYDTANWFERAQPLGGIESFSCRNTASGGEQRNADPTAQTAPCFVAPGSLYNNQQFPNLTRGNVRLKPSPAHTLAGNAPADPNRPLTTGR